MKTDYGIVLTTFPDFESAKKAAGILVSTQEAACVNILQGVVSVYFWQGTLNSDNECLLLIKTKKENYGNLENAILKLHPYTTPEIILTPIENGFAGYLKWIDENTRQVRFEV